MHSKMLRAMMLLIFFLVSSSAFGHDGNFDAKRCHNNEEMEDYHCHLAEGFSKNRDAASTQPNHSEEYYNTFFAAAVQGQREVRLDYLVPESRINGYVIVDIETASMVIEGGLDKRYSLDSVQQALFASVITGKTPAVAIYDTDGVWGKIEHRIFKAAKLAGVKFFWVSSKTYREL